MIGTSTAPALRLSAALFFVRAFRRFSDVMVAGAALLILSPVLLAMSVAILLQDGFPILFRQQRVGRGGKLFWLVKFRSMRKAAPGRLITAGNDPRITTLGRFLRKTKLDELPQLWNVLKGDMSLIGARPEVPQYVDETDPSWKRILAERPGLTGFASLIFRKEERILAAESDPERFYRERIVPYKLALNVEYMDGRSLITDWKVLFLTLSTGFGGQEPDSEAIRKAVLRRNFFGGSQ
jgi:lipopolysaccharide/colanic/teichoic acid biosynthesis glycosyltransferase